MKILRFIAVAVLLAALVGACGGDDTSADSTTTSAEDTSTTDEPTTTEPSTTEPSTTESTETTTTESSSTSSESTSSTVPTLEQPAIWPAPDVVFEDPEAAAADFVSNVFEVPPNLGEFQQGDSRSGEIEVLSPAEAGGDDVRSVLLLRQLGPDDGWFVLAAVSDINTITAPEAGGQVSAGDVEVAGEGRGFEGALVVEAFPAGQSTQLDQQLAQGGSFAETEPYSVTLDLSGAEPGDTVLILVRGGVGLGSDTGEFSAIPVTIG